MKRLTILVMLACLAAPSFAQRQKSVVPSLDEESRKGDMARMAQQRAEARFDATDENHDGLISKEEAAKHLPYIAENFERYDNKKADGFLTWEEFIGHDKWKRQAKAPGQ